MMTNPVNRVTQNETRRRRSAFRFSLIGIKPGTRLESVFDENVTCIVKDDRRVEFHGEACTLSAAAMIVARTKGYKGASIAGPRYWKCDGKTLSKIRVSTDEEK